MSDLIASLAANIVERKRAGAEPYVLFLGAGASISSGCSSMVALVDDVLQERDTTGFASWKAEIDGIASLPEQYRAAVWNEIAKRKRQRFFELWGALDPETRFAILQRHLAVPATPADGYHDLAQMIKAGYFRLALTTNLDNLLEHALEHAGWYPAQHFVVVANRRDKPEEVRYQIEHAHVPFTLVKLHGTLESPSSYAFTQPEIFDFEQSIKPTLAQVIRQSLLVVGHSMQDRDIDVLFEEVGGEIHYVNPHAPEPESPITRIMSVRRQGGLISGADAQFDAFCRQLRAMIDTKARGTRKGSERPIEDFLRQIGYEHEISVPRSRFKHLPTLYVKPSEYDQIRAQLEDKHVVFILGEPHLGKTYTALHLLWDYFQRGYEPAQCRHDRLIYLLHQHDDDMKKVALELFKSESGAPRIIHLDDPFGETMERRTDAFAKGLKTFLDLAGEYEHLRVIITTRLAIFRDAIAEEHGQALVAALEQDLRVHTSYRADVLLNIFHRYCDLYRPAWAGDPAIMATLDERLPQLLPAPHNIEFFVQTAEGFTTLEQLLEHVEVCKEMVRALAQWIGHLPEHEQIFITCLEVCSAAALLFPGEAAARMDLEQAYKQMLSYLFKTDRIAGIPTAPFARARDKFDMILVQRQGAGGRALLDFVHPSYHEAFWYAVRQALPIQCWWLLLRERAKAIFKELKERIDLVQLGMIERYGTLDRDLDRLLLLAATSTNIGEQRIAFERMLERPEIFADTPEFLTAARSLANSSDANDKARFIAAVERWFDHTSVEVLELIPPLTFDRADKIRERADAFLQKHADRLPSSVKKSRMMQEYAVIVDVFGVGFDIFRIRYDIVSRFIRSRSTGFLPLRNLNYVDKERMPETIQERNKRLGKSISEWKGCLEKITTLPTHKLRLLIDSHSMSIRSFTIEYLTSSFDKLSLEQQTLLIEQDATTLLRLLRNIRFEHLSENNLLSLIRAHLSDEDVAYYTARALLDRYESLSQPSRHFVQGLIDNPPGWWVSGAVGRITIKERFGKLSLEARQFPIKLSQHSDKRVVGALLAELAQVDSDENMGLVEMYRPLLDQLCKNLEIIHHAEAWMDHQLQVFDFYDQDYWSSVKAHLHELAEGSSSE